MVKQDGPDVIWPYRPTAELWLVFNGAIAAIHATRKRISAGRLPLSYVDALARDIQREAETCRAITAELARRGEDTGWRD